MTAYIPTSGDIVRCGPGMTRFTASKRVLLKHLRPGQIIRHANIYWTVRVVWCKRFIPIQRLIDCQYVVWATDEHGRYHQLYLSADWSYVTYERKSS